MGAIVARLTPRQPHIGVVVDGLDGELDHLLFALAWLAVAEHPVKPVDIGPEALVFVVQVLAHDTAPYLFQTIANKPNPITQTSAIAIQAQNAVQ